MPLRRLLEGNLREAHAHGMIDCEIHDIDRLILLADADWDPLRHDEKYDKWMGEIKKTFDRQFRPVQAFRGKSIPFCNVMRLKAFSNYWLDILEPGLGNREAGLAKNQITRLAQETTPATKVSLDQLRESFLRLNQWIKTSKAGRIHGVPIEIGPLLDPAARPFWVGGRVNKPETSAQYWRNRLGLIHISADNQTCQELLVRMRFVARMADNVLPRTEHLEHRRRHSIMLWVFRPSVVHQGNKRFVQGVAGDRLSRPAHRGSTRDMSSNQYPEGERELILLTGELASARLIGIDLLEGFVNKNPALDDDDVTFVDNIASQRGWT